MRSLGEKARHSEGLERVFGRGMSFATIPTMPRLLPAASSALLILGVGCGQISFGPLDGGGGASPDMGVEDAGPDDTGEMPDVGPPPDSGIDPNECKDPMAPTGWSDTPADMAWPFPRTYEAYNAVFWDTAKMSNCAAPACHGDPNNADYAPPLIPTAGLVNQRLDEAIDGLWTRVLDSRSGGWATPLWAHHPDSGNSTAHMEGEVWVGQAHRAKIEFLESFLDQAFGCYQSDWVANFSGEICTPDEDPPDAGVAMDAGEVDGGDQSLDGGGDGDGAVDAGSPPDAAGGDPECYCPLPDVSGIDTTYCATN